MCGIAGFYGFRDDNLIKKFSKELEHRGPDGEGLYITEDLTLLSRRLAIIDRKGGDQPIYNEDKSIAIVFVGEIYNFQEQRSELIKLGHKFRTKSDTEVIIHAYEEWGEKSFDNHNGMFTFALHDKRKNKLILARDHFGIKPLYFSTPKKGGIIFSSEIKPIIDSGLIPKKPDERVIYRYLKYRVHDDGRETFFKGVHRLMPGEYLTIQKSPSKHSGSRAESREKFKIQSYTNLKNELLSLASKSRDDVKIPKISKKQVAEFRTRLIEAIKLRLISEVPVGSCLSGGLDSSTVVMTVNKLLKEKVKEAESVGKIQNTFSAVFPDGTNNEEAYIDEITSSIKLASHKIYPKPEEFFKEMEAFVRTQEEPTISTGPYAQYKVMQYAQKYVTVLLDGQGADEMMAGYEPYNFFYLIQLWHEKKYWLYFKEFFAAGGLILSAAIGQLSEIFGFKSSVSVDSVLNSEFASQYQTEKFKIEVVNLKKRLIEDIFTNSLPALLRYEDKNAMKFSIEGRVPFLDFNLLKYLFSLPDEAIIKNGWNKKIMREAIKDLVPERIRLRSNKIGFTTPEYQWFMRMKNKIYSIFLSESFAKRKYFKQPAILKAFQEFIEGKNYETMLFWRLINVEIWLRIFFDPPSLKGKEEQAKKGFELGNPNSGKNLEVEVAGKTYLRYPIKTELFKKGDNFESKISDAVVQSINRLNSYSKWFICVSEKIVAISQGRSYFIWDIKPGFWAKLLSQYVKRTPYGIGLGSPWTMQLAIDEAGLPRILLATIASVGGKVMGIKGLFYKIAGNDVNAIDGPTEYSLYPSNVSAKLGPKNPEKAAEEIHTKVMGTLNSDKKNFGGVVIIDANDLGQNVLGNSTNLDSEQIEKIFKDNPMGQSDEQTPLVLVIEKN